MGAGKPTALFAYLAAVPRRTANREALVDLLWLNTEPDTARQVTDTGTQSAEATLVAELVGRESEFARAVEAWDGARAGTPVHVHVLGAPGIGKSRRAGARSPERSASAQRCTAGRRRSFSSMRWLHLRRSAGDLLTDGGGVSERSLRRVRAETPEAWARVSVPATVLDVVVR